MFASNYFANNYFASNYWSDGSEIPALIFKDLTVSSHVDPITLQRLTTLGFSDVNLSVYLDAVSLFTGVILDFKDLSVGSYVDPITLQRLTNIGFSDVDLSVYIDSIGLQRYTNLTLADINVNTQVDILSLITSYMPDINNTNVLLMDATITYSTVDSSIKYRTE